MTDPFPKEIFYYDKTGMYFGQRALAKMQEARERTGLPPKTYKTQPSKAKVSTVTRTSTVAEPLVEVVDDEFTRNQASIREYKALPSTNGYRDMSMTVGLNKDLIPSSKNTKDTVSKATAIPPSKATISRNIDLPSARSFKTTVVRSRAIVPTVTIGSSIRNRVIPPVSSFAKKLPGDTTDYQADDRGNTNVRNDRVKGNVPAVRARKTKETVHPSHIKAKRKDIQVEDEDGYFDIHDLSVFDEESFRPVEPKEKHTPLLVVNEDGEEEIHVRLYPWQEPHANLCAERLETNHGVIDCSEPGSGKTSHAIWQAQRFGMKMFVICPAKIIENWKEAVAKYSVELIGIISYESLRVRKATNPYLVPDGDKGYAATKKTIKMLYDDSVLVCVDEVQHAKNKSKQSRALISFLEVINYPSVYYKEACPSRWLLMSGTPFDRPRHSLQFMKIIGYAPNIKWFLYNKETAEYEFEDYAYEQCIDYVRSLNPQVAQSLIPRSPPTGEALETLMYDLYIQIVKPRIVSSMPKPRSGFRRYTFNTYFGHTSDKQLTRFRMAIGEISRTLAMTEEGGKRSPDAIGKLVKLMMTVHMVKVEIYVDPIRVLLERTVTDKAILLLEYNESTDYAACALADFEPIVITGSTPMAERQRLVREFNNDLNKRLLIAKLEVLGEGFDLHDQVGDSRRHIWIVPNFKIISIIQGFNRVDRVGRKSDLGIYICWVNKEESWLFGNIYEKGVNIKNTLGGAAERQIKLPASFPEYIENDYLERGVVKSYPFDWTFL